MSGDFEQVIRHFENIIRHFSLSVNEKFFRRSDNMSDFEQIIRHFEKSSAMSHGPMAFWYHIFRTLNLVTFFFYKSGYPWISAVVWLLPEMSMSDAPGLPLSGPDCSHSHLNWILRPALPISSCIQWFTLNLTWHGNKFLYRKMSTASFTLPPSKALELPQSCTKTSICFPFFSMGAVSSSEAATSVSSSLGASGPQECPVQHHQHPHHPPAPHRRPHPGRASPPAGCPMHKADGAAQPPPSSPHHHHPSRLAMQGTGGGIQQCPMREEVQKQQAAQQQQASAAGPAAGDGWVSECPAAAENPHVKAQMGDIDPTNMVRNMNYGWIEPLTNS